MAVQTYVIEETSDLIHSNEALDTWNDLVKTMGLTGQTQITQKDKSPIPFLWLNSTMKLVFETLCPTKIEISEYNKTPIPVELLQLVKMSVDEKYFQRIEVWYDDKSIDPIIVGETGYWGEMYFYADSNKELKDKEFSSKQDVVASGGVHPTFYDRGFYLIGRWADMSRSLDELKKMARERYCDNKNNEAKEQIKYYQRQIDDLEIEATKLFN